MLVSNLYQGDTLKQVTSIYLGGSKKKARIGISESVQTLKLRERLTVVVTSLTQRNMVLTIWVLMNLDKIPGVRLLGI
jgi:hypothetical protein